MLMNTIFFLATTYPRYDIIQNINNEQQSLDDFNIGLLSENPLISEPFNRYQQNAVNASSCVSVPTEELPSVPFFNNQHQENSMGKS